MTPLVAVLAAPFVFLAGAAVAIGTFAHLEEFQGDGRE